MSLKRNEVNSHNTGSAQHYTFKTPKGLYSPIYQAIATYNNPREQNNSRLCWKNIFVFEMCKNSQLFVLQFILW